MKKYRRLYLKLDRAWFAEIKDARGEWRHRSLFPKKDERAVDPSRATTLKGAWTKISRGQKPSRDEAVQRALELADEHAARVPSATVAPAPAPRSPVTEGSSVRELAAREKASGGARRGRRRKVSTEAEITRVLDDFVTWIEEHHPEVTAAEVRRPVIESYVTHLEARFKGSTVRNRVAYIRRMFEYGVERELVERNPCRKIQVAAPTLQEQQRVASNSALTENECDRLLQACREPWQTDGSCYHPPAYLYPLVLLLLRTGCRIGELVRTVKKNPATGERDERAGLRWQDIDWDERMIRIDGKTGPRRVPVIADDALDALHEFQALTGRTSGPVFTNNGDPVGRPSKSFTAAVKRAGITRRVRFHDLRHTVGTLLEKKGVRQRTIQVQLGHSSHVTTQKYVHSDARSARDEVRRAVGESGA